MVTVREKGSGMTDSMRRNRVAGRIAVFELQYKDPQPVVGDDQYYRYYFNTSDGSEYKVTLSPTSEDSFWLEFSFLDDEEGARMEMVGGKQAFEVMQNVINVVYNFMKDNRQIKEISFSASGLEPSRMRVYRKLLEKFNIKYNMVSPYMLDAYNPFYEGDSNETF
jgi:predicted transcriptional regulator